MAQRTVSRVLNGSGEENRRAGLIELGYITKKVPTFEEQARGYATHYAITRKIFEEYQMKLLDRIEGKKPTDVELVKKDPPLTNGQTPL